MQIRKNIDKLFLCLFMLAAALFGLIAGYFHFFYNSSGLFTFATVYPVVAGAGPSAAHGSG